MTSSADRLPAPGDDRDSLSHALGNRARLLRAHPTRFRCRRRRLPVSVSRPGGAGHFRVCVSQVAASIRAKVADDARLRDPGGGGGIGANRRGRRRDSAKRSRAAASSCCSATAARPPTRTIGRSTASAPPAGPAAHSRHLAFHRARHPYSARQRCRPRSNFPAAGDRAGAAERRRRRASPPAADRATSSPLSKRPAAADSQPSRCSATTAARVLRRGLADFPLVVRCDYIPRIQEVQASIYHVLRELLEVTARA